MARAITLNEARNKYPHRYTLEHVPAWARKAREDGTYYAPQYRSDAEWYENTTFPGEGHIPKRSRHCESTGCTWPMGQALTQPL